MLASVVALIRSKQRDALLFANSAGDDSTADAPFYVANEGGFSGDPNKWELLVPYGRHPNAQGMQVFEKADAENIVRDFGHFANIGVKMLGAPFYIGHPDHPAFATRYKDTRAYGRIKALKAGDEGLMANIKWSPEGKRLIESEAFHGHSVNWRMQPSGGVFRPVSLKSVGFTNEPNIAVPPVMANEKLQMNKTLALLLGLPDTATEAEIQAKCTTMANELQTAQATIVALNQMKAEYEGKKTAWPRPGEPPDGCCPGSPVEPAEMPPCCSRSSTSIRMLLRSRSWFPKRCVQPR